MEIIRFRVTDDGQLQAWDGLAGWRLVAGLSITETMELFAQIMSAQARLDARVTALEAKGN